MKHLFVNSIYRFILRPVVQLVFGVRFRNKEVLKKEKQFILVGNHNSHLDSLSLLTALPMGTFKNIRNVASHNYFGKSKFTAAMSKFWVNAELIKKGGEKTKGETALEAMDRLLKEGNSLIIFPEGTRGKPGKVEEFKHGIAVLLKQNPSIPFIPVYFDGMGRVLPKGTKLPLPLVSKVIFGKPQYANSTDVEEILQEVKSSIFELKDPGTQDLNLFYQPLPNTVLSQNH